MGIAVLDLIECSASSLPERFREAAIDVEATAGVFRAGQVPVIPMTRYRCRIAKSHAEVCVFANPGRPGYCRVVIPQARGWWPPGRRRNGRLQAALIAIVEKAGGRYPGDD